METVAVLSELMRRRGPDDTGLWSDSAHCTFAFRRLSILDLSPAGHQPMVTPDGRCAIVCNGEVYNFRELRKELAGKGVTFRSTGDTEVVLQALTHWGTEALSRFNGMFALAFYDKVEKKLLLARDHAGIKPLYYMLTPRGLVFASQYDQILAHPDSQNLSVSTDALAIYLQLGYIPEPYGILEGTQMLEAGKWMEASVDGSIRHGTYYEFPMFVEPDLRGEEACEAVDEVVTRAVRRQLISDVPVGTFLSGGIDSPLVAAKMKSVVDSPVQAFTIGTQGGMFDETSDAVRYAEEIGVEHIVEQVTPQHALDMIDDVVAACGEPFGDYSMFPTMLVSRLASQRVKVMLSGDGGDELFWGYYGRFASVLRYASDFRHPYWMRFVRRAAKKLFGRDNGNRNLYMASIGDWFCGKHCHLFPSWLGRIFPNMRAWNVQAWPDGFERFSYDGWEQDKTAQWMRHNEFTGHLPRVLLKVDRASMYHSLEVRVPLLDKEVVDVAARVDWRSCLCMERELGKLPLRYSLAKHVNHQTQAKRGFSVPMDDWMRKPLRPLFEEMLLRRQDILGVPMDALALRELYDEHLSGRANHGWGLWILLSLALWEKRFYLHRGAGVGDLVVG